jgi:hypothetical protein
VRLRKEEPEAVVNAVCRETFSAPVTLNCHLFLASGTLLCTVSSARFADIAGKIGEFFFEKCLHCFASSFNLLTS